VQETLPAAGFAVAEQIDTPTAQGSYKVHEQGLREVVTDKGYHSGAGLAEMSESVRTYVSVPQQPRRNWEGKGEQQAAVYANRRRVEGERGKSLLRRRGELLERPFAHQYETGAMRRLHVRGRANVAKRVLLQAAAFNLALILRSIMKAGTPKGLADLKRKIVLALLRVLAAHWALPAPFPESTTIHRFRSSVPTECGRIRPKSRPSRKSKKSARRSPRLKSSSWFSLRYLKFKTDVFCS
jgi:hypothetical protein